MASAKSIRDHVRQTEFLKESARVRIDRIVRRLKPTDLLGDPKRVARDLTEAVSNSMLGEIGDTLAESRKWSKSIGFEQVTAKEARAIANEAVAEWSAVFEKRAASVLGDLQGQLARDIKRGLSDKTLAKAMQSEQFRERLYGELIRPTKQMGPSLLNDIGARVRDTAMGRAKGKLVWVTTEDAHVCSDTFETACGERHDEKMTAADWREFGLPGSVILLCSSFGRQQCRCELVHSDTREADLMDRVDVSESIAAGKAQAREELG